MAERRKFLRHPVDIPIQIFLQQPEDGENVPMSDVGEGGIAFQTNVFFEQGARLKVRIPFVDPPFEAIGVVCWHRSHDNQQEIGLMFVDDGSAFQLRMVEQVCQIEKYRKQLLAEGHAISYEDAARAWIEKYAVDFGDN